jgi:hypothetical protein
MSVSSAIGVEPAVLDQSFPAVYTGTAIPTTTSTSASQTIYTLTTPTLTAGTYLANLNINYTLVNTLTNFNSLGANIQVGGSTIMASVNDFSAVSGGNINTFPTSINGCFVLDAPQTIVVNVNGLSVGNTTGDISVSGLFNLIQLSN